MGPTTAAPYAADAATWRPESEVEGSPVEAFELASRRWAATSPRVLAMERQR